MGALVSIRLTEELEKKLRKLAEEEGGDRSTLIRELLVKGLEEKQIDYAIGQYKKGKATMWKAAQIAGVSLWRMIDIFKERKVELNYSEQDFQEDIEPLMRKKRR